MLFRSPEVQAQSDLVIVLSHLGFEMDTTLAQVEPEIQVIVGGKSRRVLSAPELVGNTIIVQAGYDGEWLGRLDVTFDGQRRPIEPRVEIITLGPDIASEPVMAALVESYKQRFPSPTQGNRVDQLKTDMQPAGVAYGDGTIRAADQTRQ